MGEGEVLLEELDDVLAARVLGGDHDLHARSVARIRWSPHRSPPYRRAVGSHEGLGYGQLP
jgi:hypothetical protein